VGRQGEQEALTAYDQVPYPGHPFAQAHPDRLATVATLFGLRPADPAACRVLELGCGDGGNLVPMALALPDSAFCGVDLSPSAIDRAQALSDELGLVNVDLRAADLAALPDVGAFDYVIAHGVYSWIAPPARDALLAACRERLAPGGVAYVS
jgi:cyclopropane fatty-acyl-phospholipid synthase-like methyltransferase